MQANNNADNGKSSAIPERYNSDWIVRLDNRTTLARAVQDRLQALQGDLGGELSYQRRALCKRIVWLEALIETREAQIARGEEIAEGAHVQSINSLVGLLRAVGLERVAKNIPSLSEYAARRATERATG